MSKRRKKSTSKKTKIAFAFIIIILGVLGYLYVIYNKPSSSLKKKPKESTLKIVDENSNQRPIAVMIDNNIGNEKHAGLQDSYINYEIIVEGGLTRIMALYKDKEVSLIGPVRSSRHYFLDYALESDAIYTHYGWSTYAKNDINSGFIDVNKLM